MSEPRTAAGHRLFHMVREREPFIDSPTNTGMAAREWLHAILAIEAEAAADALRERDEAVRLLRELIAMWRQQSITLGLPKTAAEAQREVDLHLREAARRRAAA